MTKTPAMPEPTQEQLDAFIARAGFRYGWGNLESWARTMAEQAVSELAALQSAQPAEVSDAKWEGAEEWMPLAWELCADECGEEACTELVWEGGPIPEPWGDRWLKYEDEAKRLIELVRKHVPSLRPQAVPMTDEQSELEAEVERLRGLLKLESLRDHSHQCLLCLHPYTPLENQSEDCPSCGFDGITAQGAQVGEVE